ncbi:MAG TPA: GNAT family N-acetyltransferase [Anaerolineae bacterium]|nr:GNAT family N-acetyltransferase [Anaerolineae bacterium]
MLADVEPGVRPSLLAHQIEAQTRDLAWTLAHYTFVADVTMLANECDITHSPGMSVASCHRLPLPVLAFVGESADLLANYATFLTDPGSDVYLMVNEAQRAIVEAAFEVQETTPEWQMVFNGSLPASEAVSLDAEVTALDEHDLPAMRALAESGGLKLLEHDPFVAGPAFGVRKGRKLVSMATTRLRVPGAAEIGNVVTHKDHRRRGYASAVVAALVRALAAEGVAVFLQVYQNKPECIALYQKLGFEIVRPMYWVRCRVKEVASGE